MDSLLCNGAPAALPWSEWLSATLSAAAALAAVPATCTPVLCRCGTTCWPLPARDARPPLVWPVAVAAPLRPWPPPGTDLRTAPPAAAADDGAAARLAADSCDRGRQPATAAQVTADPAMPRSPPFVPVGSQRDASPAIGANARSRSAGSGASDLPSVRSEPAFRTVYSGGLRRAPRLAGCTAGPRLSNAFQALADSEGDLVVEVPSHGVDEGCGTKRLHNGVGFLPRPTARGAAGRRAVGTPSGAAPMGTSRSDAAEMQSGTTQRAAGVSAVEMQSGTASPGTPHGKMAQTWSGSTQLEWEPSHGRDGMKLHNGDLLLPRPIAPDTGHGFGVGTQSGSTPVQLTHGGDADTQSASTQPEWEPSHGRGKTKLHNGDPFLPRPSALGEKRGLGVETQTDSTPPRPLRGAAADMKSVSTQWELEPSHGRGKKTLHHGDLSLPRPTALDDERGLGAGTQTGSASPRPPGGVAADTQSASTLPKAKSEPPQGRRVRTRLRRPDAAGVHAAGTQAGVSPAGTSRGGAAETKSASALWESEPCAAGMQSGSVPPGTPLGGVEKTRSGPTQWEMEPSHGRWVKAKLHNDDPFLPPAAPGDGCTGAAGPLADANGELERYGPYPRAAEDGIYIIWQRFPECVQALRSSGVNVDRDNVLAHLRTFPEVRKWYAAASLADVRDTMPLAKDFVAKLCETWAAENPDASVVPPACSNHAG